MLNTGAQEITQLLHSHITSHLTAHWLQRHVCLIHTPILKSALLPVHQQTRPGKCTVAAQPCCWCWSPPASAHQRWFCPPDPVEKAVTLRWLLGAISTDKQLVIATDELMEHNNSHHPVVQAFHVIKKITMQATSNYSTKFTWLVNVWKESLQWFCCICLRNRAFNIFWKVTNLKG